MFVPPVGLTESSVQLGTESGTYKLDPAKLIPIENSHLKYSFWDISSAGNCVLQNANQLMMYRVEVIDGNLYYDRDRIVGQYNKIGNPSNHYKGEYELFRIGNKIGYNLQLSARMMSLSCVTMMTISVLSIREDIIPLLGQTVIVNRFPLYPESIPGIPAWILLLP